MAIGNEGRHKVSVAVGFDREVFAMLNLLAKHDDRSFSAIVRMLIKEALAKRSPQATVESEGK